MEIFPMSVIRRLAAATLLLSVIVGAAPLANGGPGADSGPVAARPGHVPTDLDVAHEAPSAAKIIGPDDRIQVERTTRYPFSTVAKLYSRFLDGSRIEGTCALVGRRHVLTAGHMVHDPKRGGFAVDLEVVLALELGNAPYGSAFGKVIHTFPQFVVARKRAYDVALVELDVDAGSEAGWLGLGVANDAGLTDWPVNNAGYPLDLTSGESMWYAGGDVAGVTGTQILLGDPFDATEGQTGSPLWQRNENNERIAVGVLVDEGKLFNVGTRITHEIYGYLTAWLDGFEAPADLLPKGTTTDLPFESPGGTEGTVSCDVRNRGDRRATVLVEAFLEDERMDRTLLGTVVTEIRPGRTVRVDIPALVPLDAPTGVRRVVVEVNGDFGSPESDRANNQDRGPLVYVLPDPADDLWTPVDVPSKQREKLRPAEEARYELRVTEAGQRLRVKLTGRKFRGDAVLVAPDGTQFEMDTRRNEKVVVDDAETGRWLVLVRNPSSARFARKFKLKLELR
jgi:V8-like Glu-specific endopeptidase